MGKRKQPEPLPNPLLAMLNTHYAKYLSQRPQGALTTREIVADSGKTISQVKAFLQTELEAGRIKNGRVIRAHGGGFDVVYWVENTPPPK